jgi:hypothetical protein
MTTITKDAASSLTTEELRLKKLWEDAHPDDPHSFSGRPPWKLRTKEEGERWLAEMEEFRKAHPLRLPEGVSSVDLVREERDAR